MYNAVKEKGIPCCHILFEGAASYSLENVFVGELFISIIISSIYISNLR